MTKLHKTATTLLLTASLLLGGCAEQGSVLDTNTDSGSSSEPDKSSDSMSENQSEAISGEKSENSSEESSDVIIPAVPIEFTDEDRELQKILGDLEKNLEVFSDWLTFDGMVCNTTEQIFRITNAKNKSPRSYYPIPDNFLYREMIIPNTYESMHKMLLDNFSEQLTDELMKSYVRKGSIKEGADGVLEVTINEEDLGSLRFIDIDGTLYKRHALGGGRGLSNMFVDCESAKIVSKTDDTIVFTYLSGFIQWGELNHQEELNDESLYAERAKTGVLKYERGGWRRDWDKNNVS